MSTHILVTYASQGGSTAGIALSIGQSLAAAGALVDVRPAAEVDGLGRYQAAVIGSAVHSGKWMPAAVALIERNRDELRRIPTAIFQVCLMQAVENAQYRAMITDWLASYRAMLRPAAEASFAGALLPAQYPKLTDRLGLRIFLAAIHLKAGDYRDWDAVHAWAESLRPLFIRQSL